MAFRPQYNAFQKKTLFLWLALSIAQHQTKTVLRRIRSIALYEGGPNPRTARSAVRIGTRSSSTTRRMGGQVPRFSGLLAL